MTTDNQPLTTDQCKYNKIGDAEPESPRHLFDVYRLLSAERFSALWLRVGRGRRLLCFLFLSSCVSQCGGSLTGRFGLLLILSLLVGFALHVG